MQQQQQQKNVCMDVTETEMAAGEVAGHVTELLTPLACDLLEVKTHS